MIILRPFCTSASVNTPDGRKFMLAAIGYECCFFPFLAGNHYTNTPAWTLFEK
jgi:hypothetical protein